MFLVKAPSSPVLELCNFAQCMRDNFFALAQICKLLSAEKTKLSGSGEELVDLSGCRMQTWYDWSSKSHDNVLCKEVPGQD